MNEHIALTPGFESPVLGAQSAFRQILTAMSEPGTIVEIGGEITAPVPLNSASGAVCLTLLDFETTLLLDGQADAEVAQEWVKFHCGCTLTHVADEAQFAVFGDGDVLGCLEELSVGTDEFPEHGATAIIQVDGLSQDGALSLNGPGISGQRSLGIDGLTPDFWDRRNMINQQFPRGLDFIFTVGARLAALPRTTIVEAA